MNTIEEEWLRQKDDKDAVAEWVVDCIEVPNFMRKYIDAEMRRRGIDTARVKLHKHWFKDSVFTVLGTFTWLEIEYLRAVQRAMDW